LDGAIGIDPRDLDGGEGVRKRGNIVSYSANELEGMIERGDDQTDWARVDAMTEAELEAAIASDPDWAEIPPDWYKHATPCYAEATQA
jgi:hypothetical protein